MFYPAGDEPLGYESSDDEYCIESTKRRLEDKQETTNDEMCLEPPQSIWTSSARDKPSSAMKQMMNNPREHVMVQTSMGNENFRIAILQGDLDRVDQMLSTGFEVETRLKGGWTPLMYACERGTFSIVQLLITNGANSNSHKDTLTPLMCLGSCKSLSSEEDLVKCAKLLIEEGARVNARDRHYMSPLMYACQSGHITLVQVLLTSEADPNYQDARGWTALCFVANSGNTALATLLLDNGANPKLATYYGDTPSSIALATGYTCLANLLEGKPLPATPADTGDKPIIDGQQPAAGDGGNPSYKQLDDLELFLAGLKLRQLEPIFESHCVDFQRLLTLTDEDLDNMGITQVGIRKTLMDAITDLHKSNWKMPEQPFEVRRGLSIEEYSVVLCQLGSHIDYVSSSAAFLINHTSNSSTDSTGSHTPFVMVTTKQQSQELSHQIDSVVKAGKKLLEKITALEKSVYKELGTPSGSSAALMKNTECSKLSQVVKTVGLTFGLSFFGFVVYCLATKKPMMPMMERVMKNCQDHCPAVLNQFL